MKSDHLPLRVKLRISPISQHNKQVMHTQKKALPKGKILINQENRELFNAALKQHFHDLENNVESKAAKKVDVLHNNLLIPIIHKALNACKRSHPKMGTANTFPANPWYDEECKAAKRSLMKRGRGKELKKKYEKLVQSKKIEYVNERRKELITLGKHNPKGFWRELQQKKKVVENNITDAQWLEYARLLYERAHEKDYPPVINTPAELFNVDDIKQGIKNLASGKAQDIDGLQSEFLKWGTEILAPHIKRIFNNVNREGFPMEWTTSVVIPLFKSGDINNPSNYRTIMVNSIFGKLFGSMIERRISKWAENEGKRAKGQAGFRSKHSTIDHCITLRHLIEKIWDNQGEEAYCCFVDFKKAFDTVPRDKLWSRMEELGIPNAYRAAVHRLYEKVSAKIRTSEGMSECFDSDIGVKQGCPLSPTLFGLYIDKLEAWLSKEGGDGIHLAGYVVKLLLYADDLILISKTAHGLREHLKALEHFCQEVGMQVNTSKTKIMIYSLNRKIKQHTFLFEGSPLDIVKEYKYLGIDFHYKLSWETCRTKRIQGGWKAYYLLQNRCRKAELWDWKTKKTLFGLLVTPVVLYGCEVWGSNTSKCSWRQIERIQKHLITNNLKVKATVPYEILLAEAGAFPLEASAITRLLSYLKKVENMDNHRWPKTVMEEILVRRKKTWMKQNIKWLNKWNIKLHECPDTNSEIKIYVKEKFRTAMWSNQIGRKKAYYIKEFNPAKEHGEKPYLGATIKGKARLLIAQLRTGSHHLRCETGRWKTPKETWEERTCLFCNKGVVETEWHFVMECTAYENIRNQYSSISDVGNMQQLFEEDKINQTASLLVKINSRRSDLEKSLETN